MALRRFKERYTVIGLFAAFVILVLYMGHMEPTVRQESVHRRFSDYKGYSKTKPLKNSFLLFSMYRTGASAIGELLKAHPDVYYMYEPMKLASLNENTYYKLQRNYINYFFQLFRCHLTDYFNQVESLYAKDMSPDLFGWRVKSFCTFKTTLDCESFTAAQFGQTCRSKMYVVAKEVHVAGMEHLPELTLHGVKIIHIVRDPRGTINSIRNVDREDKTGEKPIEQYAKSVCSLLGDQIRMAMDVFRSDRDYFKLVRFEDIVINPANKLPGLYNFLQLQMPEGTIEAARNGPVEEVPDADMIRPYKRYSPMNWREQLTWDEVKVIQDVCGYSFKVLGYRILNNPQELTDETVNILGELNPVFM